jgi:phosphopantothenoylcysteine decarboxylase
MLQTITHEHDYHYLASQSNSIEALVASKDDGKRHLLLAYALDSSAISVLIAHSSDRQTHV